MSNLVVCNAIIVESVVFTLSIHRPHCAGLSVHDLLHAIFLSFFTLTIPSHLRLNLLQQRLQLVLPGTHLRPPDPQALLLVRLGNHVHVDMVHLLVRQPSIVLQDVVILCPCRGGDLLRDG